MGELILLKNGEEAYMKPDSNQNLEQTAENFGNTARAENAPNHAQSDFWQMPSHDGANDENIIDVDTDEAVAQSMQWPTSLPQTISILLARTWYDPVFKTAFMTNPMQVVASLNVPLPEGTTLYVDEARGKCRVTVYEYNARTHRHKRGMTLKLNLTAGF